MAEKIVYETCPQCGNKCNLKILNSFLEKMENPYDYDGYTLSYETDWQILRCPVCEQTLLNKHTYQFTIDDDEIIKDEILYPSNNTSFNHVPKSVREVYESLINSIYSDSKMALMKMRKILSMICENKNVENNDLRIQLLDLYEKGFISKKILLLCNIIRELGNDITHKTKSVDIEQEDLYEIKRMIEIILFYVYEIDNKIKHFYHKYNIKQLNKKNDKEQKIFDNWKVNYEKVNIAVFKPHWLLELSDDYIKKLVSNEKIKHQMKEKIKNYFKSNNRVNSRIVKIYYKYFEQ